MGVTLLKKLPLPIRKYLRMFSSLAESLNYKIFLVGGIVRDLLLGEENLDLDIVVEGDAIEFVKVFSKKLKAEFIKHHSFGTATLYLNNNLKVDFATARKEFYPYWGALPKVVASTIREDLFRRDFTINAMAMSLNRESWGNILDFYGGINDLDRGLIRVLHPKSFLEDPTRIFRAIRFEQRFSFRIEPHTFSLLKEAIRLGAIKWIDEHRIRDELILILKEPAPYRYIRRINQLIGFSFINEKLILKKSDFLLLMRIQRALHIYKKKFKKCRELQGWIIYLAGIVYKLTENALFQFFSQFGLRKGERKIILSIKESFSKVRHLKRVKPKVGIFEILKPLSFEAVVFFYAYFKDKTIRKKICVFLEKLAHIRLKLRGEDLKRVGYKDKTNYTKIFKRLLHKKIEKNISTKSQELKELKRLLT
ncbi:MAG: hypothetical protein DRP68_00920 [Candidatus Omnitrophota bacterium]|nr:MAG: hypothetical protein DRP68_00920 [Candidatus Omnitrophota bacterium]RKY38113.1 MAG: hypothetical protein DRP72_02455 [Candidatus Omnitrophota bacterium]RKY46393.1 MAG: hypothetical protein DRP81_00770 [Candidatus Omnitrophota bacterium]HDN85972.1 CCA tRNA nucleotidyltransferase [Candidatus Omnitrophota bacterium]